MGREPEPSRCPSSRSGLSVSLARQPTDVVDHPLGHRSTRAAPAARTGVQGRRARGRQPEQTEGHPTTSSPLVLTPSVVPSWGGQALDGAEALWHSQMAYGVGPHPMYSSDGRSTPRSATGRRSAPAS